MREFKNRLHRVGAGTYELPIRSVAWRCHRFPHRWRERSTIDAGYTASSHSSRVPAAASKHSKQNSTYYHTSQITPIFSFHPHSIQFHRSQSRVKEKQTILIISPKYSNKTKCSDYSVITCGCREVCVFDCSTVRARCFFSLHFFFFFHRLVDNKSFIKTLLVII